MRHLILVCAASAMLWPASVLANEPDGAKEMSQRIAGALRESGELQNYRVGIKFDDGVAWLLGSVTNTQQSEAAIRLASEVPGVQHVVNRLEVTNPEPVASTSKAKVAAPADDTGLRLAASLQSNSSELPPTPVAEPAPLPRHAAKQAPRGMPRPMQRTGGVQAASYGHAYGGGGGMPTPQGYTTGGAAGVSYDQAHLPNHAWPSYAAYPNYSAVTYPKQYSPSAWPYIGPFYPYPQVPLGWRKVTLEWDDGWWNLDFSHHKGH